MNVKLCLLNQEMKKSSGDFYSAYKNLPAAGLITGGVTYLRAQLILELILIGLQKEATRGLFLLLFCFRLKIFLLG